MKFVTSNNPIHRDLSQKLSNDLWRATGIATELCHSIKATPEEIAGIVLSALANVICGLEEANNLPPGVVEDYIAKYRVAKKECEQ